MAISSADNQIIIVNLVPGRIAKPVIHLSQYDNGAGRPIHFDIFDGEQEYLIPNGVSVTLEGTKPDGHGFSYTTTKSNSTVIVDEYTNQMTAVVGLTHAQLVFTDISGARAGTIPIIIDVSRAGINNETIVSDTDIDAIAEAKDDYNRLMARFDAAISEGTVDGELLDIRIKADGTTAQTAGDAVREQISGLSTDISAIESDLETGLEEVNTSITTLETRLDGEIDSLDSRVDVLETDVGELKTDVSTLETGLSNAVSDISDLETGLANAVSDISDLETDLADAVSDIADVKSDLVETNTAVSALETTLASTLRYTVIKSIEDI